MLTERMTQNCSKYLWCSTYNIILINPLQTMMLYENTEDYETWNIKNYSTLVWSIFSTTYMDLPLNCLWLPLMHISVWLYAAHFSNGLERHCWSWSEISLQITSEHWILHSLKLNCFEHISSIWICTPFT